MLDYFFHNEQLVIVLERPEHCCDLYDFISGRPNGLDERLARDFIKQIIQILKMLEYHTKGVIRYTNITNEHCITSFVGKAALFLPKYIIFCFYKNAVNLNRLIDWL